MNLNEMKFCFKIKTLPEDRITFVCAYIYMPKWYILSILNAHMSNMIMVKIMDIDYDDQHQIIIIIFNSDWSSGFTKTTI